MTITFFSSGQQKERVSVTNAELVFVGYGIQAPEYQWDDYKGADLAGKILVMMNNDPDWDPKLFAGKRRLYYGRWDYKYESATRHRLPVRSSSTRPPRPVTRSRWCRAPGVGSSSSLPAGSEARMSVHAWASEDAVRRLLKSAGFDLDKLIESAHSRDFKPVPLDSTTSLTFTNTLSRVKTANVGGVLPGNDPKLAPQVLIYSAHHDHFGIGEPDKTGDKIYHGAVDNASGCAQVLAIARAFAALPQRPRRTIMALFVAGEERGLLGSATMRSTLPCPRAASPPTSTSTAATSLAARAMRWRSATASPRWTRWPRVSRNRRGARWSVTSTRTAAITIAPISSRSPRSACRRCTSARAPTSSASPPAGVSSSTMNGS